MANRGSFLQHEADRNGLLLLRRLLHVHDGMIEQPLVRLHALGGLAQSEAAAVLLHLALHASGFCGFIERQAASMSSSVRVIFS